MKTVLFIGINARYTHTALAIRCLRNAAEAVNNKDCYRLLEFQINEPVQHIVYTIVSQKPDVILFSVYIWNKNILELILPDTHALLPEAKIVLGGPEVYGSRTWFMTKFPFITACMEGYGETAIKALAKEQWENIPQLLEKLPAWDPHDFLAAGVPYKLEEKDMLSHRYLYYESSRGCPFTCAYCLSSNKDQHFIEKPVETVYNEIAYLLQFDPTLIKFVDRSFNAHPERARTLWNYLARTYRSRSVRFHFEIMPSMLIQEDITLLTSLPQHLFQFEIGIQSIHEKTRKLIHRAGTWEQEREMLATLAHNVSILLHVDMIVGLPGETDADIAETFDALMDLGVEHVQVGFLKVLPGTEIFLKKQDYGIIAMESAPYEVYATATLSLADKMKWKQITLLVESIANTALASHHMKKAREYFGSWTKAYESLLAYMLRENFDIRTKNRERLLPLIDAWSASFV